MTGRDPDWRKLNTEFTIDVTKVATALLLVPPFLRPSVFIHVYVMIIRLSGTFADSQRSSSPVLLLATEELLSICAPLSRSAGRSRQNMDRSRIGLTSRYVSQLTGY